MSFPTLATLIEACGENFGALGRETACWLACEYVSERAEWENAHEGETPEDAVAGLWLSLNQRVEEESGALPVATSPNPTRKILGLLSTIAKRR